MERTNLPKAKVEALGKDIVSTSAMDNPKLQQAKAILTLSKCLGEKLMKFFEYGIIKGSILRIYFNHPAVLVEFRSKKNEILAKMRIVYKEESMRKDLVFSDVQGFSIPTVPKKPSPSTNPILKEKSTGFFAIDNSNIELKKIFEKIRTCIKESQNV